MKLCVFAVDGVLGDAFLASLIVFRVLALFGVCCVFGGRFRCAGVDSGTGCCFMAAAFKIRIDSPAEKVALFRHLFRVGLPRPYFQCFPQQDCRYDFYFCFIILCRVPVCFTAIVVASGHHSRHDINPAFHYGKTQVNFPG